METVQRGDEWWRQGDDGTWYRWSEPERAWELAPVDAPAAAAVYRSPRGMARWLAMLLGAGIVLNVAAVAVFAAEFRALDGAARGAVLSDARITAGQDRVALLATALFITLVATVPAFVAWFHRLYCNLPALGVSELRFRPGWAIGGWFVPVLNLWRPKQIADDIWRGSDPAAAPGSDPDPRQRPVAGLVHLWWALYLGANLVNQAIVRYSMDADTTGEQRLEALFQTGGGVLDATTAAVALWFVLRLTARHEQRASGGHPGGV